MIYSGYEHGHYFVRFAHDVKVLDIMDILHSGYRLLSGHMLLLKRREMFYAETVPKPTGGY